MGAVDMSFSKRAPARRFLMASSVLTLSLLLPGLAPAQETETEAQAVDGSLALDTIIVTGTGATTEGTGAWTAPDVTPSATGLPLTERELPQSVSITTSQQIEDQNFQTLDQALEYTPGITAVRGNGEMRWSYFARGSEITNLQYDGVPTFIHWFARDANPQDDLALYERIEVVRGATGLLEGTGNPSASVNLVRKRPFADRQVSTDFSLTNYGSAELTFDASTPLNQAGTIRGRFVGNALGGDGPRDNLTDERVLLYGTLDVDIGDATTANIGLSYVDEDIDGYSWGGIWTDYDGSFFPNFDGETSPSLDWEYSYREAWTGYAEIKHELENGWTLKASARYNDGETDMFTSYMRWQQPADEIVLERSGGRFEYINENFSGDVQAAGPVTLFNRSHDLVIGVNGGHDRTRYDGGSDYLFVIDPPDRANPHAEPKPPTGPKSYYGDMTTEQWGVYSAGRFSLTDQLKLIAGGRFTWYDYEDDFGDDSASSYSVDGEFLPYVGAVYDVNETWSVYASYTEIFQPQQAYDRSGLLDPITGSNLEAGVKAAFLDGALTASAAVFRTDRDGIAEPDPNNQGCGPGPFPSCSKPAGLVRTQGVEFEVVGAVSDRWNVFAGYTHVISEYEEGENSGDRFEPNVNPENLLKLGTTYQFAGALKDLTLGGSLRYQSETYSEGSDWASADQPFKMRQGGFTVVDVMARYQLTEQTSLQLNIDNLFDKLYYTGLWNPGYGNWIGAPRTATLSLSHTF